MAIGQVEDRNAEKVLTKEGITTKGGSVKITMDANKKLTIFPIGIGNKADMDTLERFSPTRKPLHIKETKFPIFFEWLSQSVSITSKSMPGERIQLDESKIKDWAEL